MEGKTRIIQELVPGRQVTLAHIIASPDSSLYEKIGLEFFGEKRKTSIGILSTTPGEVAVIAADIAIKTSRIELESIDSTSGTLILQEVFQR
jgi:ethanolamine utilization protein EutS